MEAVSKTANKFWNWFSSIDDAYFILASVFIMVGVIFYLLKVFWDNQEEEAVARINAIFDAVKKSPAGRVAILVFAYLGLASNDSDNNDTHSS
jgi:hypothetical protein